jgi:transcriptional regulator with XRE-family HTH domain
MMSAGLTRIFEMDFPHRLAALRKEKGLTQQALADRVGVHVMQIRRYEGAGSQPTLDVIRRLAVALSVSADTLLFEPEDRGPSDDLRLQFEAVAQFDPESRKVAKTVLDGLILHYQAKRLAASDQGASERAKAG